jgi:inorganic pyrophosphatase
LCFRFGLSPLTKSQEALFVYLFSLRVFTTPFTGECIAVIHRLNDNDDKLVLVPRGQMLTDQQIRDQTNFQEKYFDSVILRERPKDLK